MTNTKKVLLIASLTLMMGVAPVLAGSSKADKKSTLKCTIKTTIVAFVSSTPREIKYCKFKGEVQGRDEFLAGCSNRFVVDGREYKVDGTPDKFGIVTLNLDVIAPVLADHSSDAIQIASSIPTQSSNSSQTGGRN